MAKSIRAFFIDAKRHAILKGSVSSLAGMQLAVGGNIELGMRLSDGNVLYVDEEGLLKQPNDFILVDGRPFAGSGLVVGPTDEDGNDTDAQGTLESLCKRVEFVDASNVGLYL